MPQDISINCMCDVRHLTVCVVAVVGAVCDYWTRFHYNK